MDDQRVGAAVRALRVRRNWRQEDLAQAARVSRSTVSRLERGHFERLSMATLRAVAAALDMRLQVLPLWRGGEVDRLLNARHSAMHEAVARMFAKLEGWVTLPEVSFSVYGERGVIDVLAWHATTRALLVVELKTEIVDVQELVGTLDRKRRLAARIGREHGWAPVGVGAWLLVAEGSTNRDRVRAHATMLGAAYPAGAWEMRGWLRAPAGPIAALSFLGHGAGRPGAGRPGAGRPGAGRPGAGHGAGQPGAGRPAGSGAGHGAGQPILRYGHAGNLVQDFAPRKRVRVRSSPPPGGSAE